MMLCGPFSVLRFQRWLSGEEDRCTYKMHSLTQDRSGRQTALGYDALNEGPEGSGGGNCLDEGGNWTLDSTMPQVRAPLVG